MCNITQQLTKKTDPLNSTHENLSEDTATFQSRCKQYFSVKLQKLTKNGTDIFEGPIKI